MTPDFSNQVIHSTVLRRTIRRIGMVSVTAIVATTMACQTDVTMPPPMDISQLYWELRINHPAIQLSTIPPYNTVQLDAIAYTPDDQVWGGDSTTLQTDTTVWISADSSKVLVSQNGLVTARAATASNGVFVIVKRQIGPVAHSDTTRVHVSTLTNPQIPASLSFRPSDSTKRAFGLFPVVLPAPVVKDTNNVLISGLPIAYRSTNSALARYATKWSNSLTFVSTISPGVTTITASTFAYGIAKADTFVLEFGMPISLFVGNPVVAQRALADGSTAIRLVSSRQNIGPGGVVYWENASAIRPTGFTGELKPGSPIDVMFEDTIHVLEANSPNASGSGNMIGIPSDSTLPVLSRRRYRRFLQPGEYRYTILPFGFTGVVVVSDR